MRIFVAVAWPYANGDLHLGHLAGALLSPDIFARYHRLKGREVLMVSGTDMHGSPTEVVAEKEGVEPKVISARNHLNHVQTLRDMNIDFNLYTDTDTKNHEKVVQELFVDLFEKGYMVKKKVKQYWSEKEKKFLLDRFIEGECPHCNYDGARGDQCDKCGRTLEPTELINPRSNKGDTELELVEDEDYFLELPKLQKDLETWIENHPNSQNWRKNVMSFTKGWFKEGLKARPMTRNLSYGIPLPEGVEIKDKEKKVIYVWFDGVTGYLSAAKEWNKLCKEGEIDTSQKIFRKDKEQSTNWEDYWKSTESKHYYFMGKDNIIFHTIIWPAILIVWNKDKKPEDKLNLPFDVPANAFLNLEGGKMSKSKNRQIDVRYLLDTYGQDLVRFYFSMRSPENKDSDFKWKDFVAVNNNELVANLGNFIHRVLTFVDTRFEGIIPDGKLEKEVEFKITDTFHDTEELIEGVKLSEALSRIFMLVSFGNKYFDKSKVWAVVKEDKKKAGEIIFNCLQMINALRVLLYPYIPSSMEKLREMLSQKELGNEVGKDRWRYEKVSSGFKISTPKVLFKKLDDSIVEKEVSKLGN